VLKYNTALQTFPWLFVAWLGSFETLEFVHTEDPAAQQAPAVQFASSS
jgi:hypothetical protein